MIHIEEVFYDKRINRFIQVRGMHDDFVIISNGCKYFNDAKTTISSSRVSQDYVRELEPVGCIDKFTSAKYDTNVDGFRVKEGRDDE